MPEHYTTKQVGEFLHRPEWLIRRVVDSLDVPVARFGGKRAIPASRLAEVAEALKERESKTREAEVAIA